MVGVCPHVHLSSISGHFQSIYHFSASQGISSRYSGRFPVRCIIPEHLRAFSYNMENTVEEILENTYRGFFFQNMYGGSFLCMAERGILENTYVGNFSEVWGDMIWEEYYGEI